MEKEQEKSKFRTRIYIDGYNLYYGCLKNTPFKWLDLIALFEKFILPTISVEDSEGKDATIELLPLSIKFFTAPILASAAKSDDSVSSQSTYHNALKTLYPGRIELIQGYYSSLQNVAPKIDPDNPDLPPRDCIRVSVWKLEEKQSDVNLALHAYHDVMSNEVDHVIIVTNDTDIAPALKMIRNLKGDSVRIGLVIPTKEGSREPNTELRQYADWTRKFISEHELKSSQLPRVIQGKRKAISKPDSWFPNHDIFLQILKLAKDTLGTRSKAYQWLEAKNSRYEDMRPIDMIETLEGANTILQYCIDYDSQLAAKKEAIDIQTKG